MYKKHIEILFAFVWCLFYGVCGEAFVPPVCLVSLISSFHLVEEIIRKRTQTGTAFNRRAGSGSGHSATATRSGSRFGDSVVFDSRLCYAMREKATSVAGTKDSNVLTSSRNRPLLILSPHRFVVLRTRSFGSVHIWLRPR